MNTVLKLQRSAAQLLVVLMWVSIVQSLDFLLHEIRHDSTPDGDCLYIGGASR